MSAQDRLGYKLTEAGVIPDDWEAIQLENICTLVNGRGFKPHEWESSGLPIIRIQNLNGSDEFNYYTGKYDQKILVESEQLLFAWSGSRGTSFGPHIWKGGNALLNYHTWKIVIDESKIDARYFYYALKDLTACIEKDAHGASALVHTQKCEMEKYYVRVPPLELQREIANYLFDMDGLINGLDRLIAKKRDVKQATMQQLLTGQQRLPGFSGEWEVKLLGAVCWFQEGPGVRNTQFTNSGVKLLNGTNIYRGKVNLDTTSRFISASEAFGAYSHFLADAGDIVIACSGITIDKFDEKIAFVRTEHLPLCMNTSTMRFKVREGVLNNIYMYQFLMSNIFKSQIGLEATGSAQLNFGPSHVGKISVPLPLVGEQAAIATILTDMDSELATLETRRDKARQLKQGMMQELLTGRNRLSQSSQGA